MLILSRQSGFWAVVFCGLCLGAGFSLGCLANEDALKASELEIVDRDGRTRIFVGPTDDGGRYVLRILGPSGKELVELSGSEDGGRVEFRDERGSAVPRIVMSVEQGESEVLGFYSDGSKAWRLGDDPEDGGTSMQLWSVGERSVKLYAHRDEVGMLTNDAPGSSTK